MKRIYQKPETQCHIGICDQMLASSSITIGGTGNFDVKEDTHWADIWLDETDEHQE
ncbi:MAG: hypothetical protein K6G92_05115 [Bacteroidaceae bacterium]|nr:hypothetical protein [Bacteroidaceae bacterium]